MCTCYFLEICKKIGCFFLKLCTYPVRKKNYWRTTQIWKSTSTIHPPIVIYWNALFELLLSYRVDTSEWNSDLYRLVSSSTLRGRRTTVCNPLEYVRCEPNDRLLIYAVFRNPDGAAEAKALSAGRLRRSSSLPLSDEGKGRLSSLTSMKCSR